MTELVSGVGEISRIAYGFIASKALFVALQFDLFSQLTGPGRTLAELVDATGIPANRLQTLLTALTSLGLVAKHGRGYRNAPASQRYLVRGAPTFMGDYYQFQIDRHVYPALQHLRAGLAGERAHLAFQGLEDFMADPVEADAFTRAQHAASLGPAVLLCRSVDLSLYRSLLDVGGGSGAFSIVLCQHFSALTATILDFPNVIAVAQRCVRQAGLTSRIRFVSGHALETAWPAGQDVILMSYLLSAVGGQDIPRLVDKAWDSLRPGGLLLIHDFVLDNDGAGPTFAALWFLSYLAIGTDTVSFSVETLTTLLTQRQFTGISDRVLIPEMTKLVRGYKPA